MFSRLNQYDAVLNSSRPPVHLFSPQALPQTFRVGWIFDAAALTRESSDGHG